MTSWNQLDTTLCASIPIALDCLAPDNLALLNLYLAYYPECYFIERQREKKALVQAIRGLKNLDNPESRQQIKAYMAANTDDNWYLNRVKKDLKSAKNSELTIFSHYLSSDLLRLCEDVLPKLAQYAQKALDELEAINTQQLSTDVQADIIKLQLYFSRLAKNIQHENEILARELLARFKLVLQSKDLYYDDRLLDPNKKVAVKSHVYHPQTPRRRFNDKTANSKFLTVFHRHIHQHGDEIVKAELVKMRWFAGDLLTTKTGTLIAKPKLIKTSDIPLEKKWPAWLNRGVNARYQFFSQWHQMVALDLAITANTGNKIPRNLEKLTQAADQLNLEKQRTLQAKKKLYWFNWQSHRVFTAWQVQLEQYQEVIIQEQLTWIENVAEQDLITVMNSVQYKSICQLMQTLPAVISKLTTPSLLTRLQILQTTLAGKVHEYVRTLLVSDVSLLPSRPLNSTGSRQKILNSDNLEKLISDKMFLANPAARQAMQTLIAWLKGEHVFAIKDLKRMLIPLFSGLRFGTQNEAIDSFLRRLVERFILPLNFRVDSNYDRLLRAFDQYYLTQLGPRYHASRHYQLAEAQAKIAAILSLPGKFDLTKSSVTIMIDGTEQSISLDQALRAIEILYDPAAKTSIKITIFDEYLANFDGRLTHMEPLISATGDSSLIKTFVLKVIQYRLKMGDYKNIRFRCDPSYSELATVYQAQLNQVVISDLTQFSYENLQDFQQLDALLTNQTKESIAIEMDIRGLALLQQWVTEGKSLSIQSFLNSQAGSAFPFGATDIGKLALQQWIEKLLKLPGYSAASRLIIEAFGSIEAQQLYRRRWLQTILTDPVFSADQLALDNENDPMDPMSLAIFYGTDKDGSLKGIIENALKYYQEHWEKYGADQNPVGLQLIHTYFKSREFFEYYSWPDTRLIYETLIENIKSRKLIADLKKELALRLEHGDYDKVASKLEFLRHYASTNSTAQQHAMHLFTEIFNFLQIHIVHLIRDSFKNRTPIAPTLAAISELLKLIPDLPSHQPGHLKKHLLAVCADRHEINAIPERLTASLLAYFYQGGHLDSIITPLHLHIFALNVFSDSQKASLISGLNYAAVIATADQKPIIAAAVKVLANPGLIFDKNAEALLQTFFKNAPTDRIRHGRQPEIPKTTALINEREQLQLSMINSAINVLEIHSPLIQQGKAELCQFETVLSTARVFNALSMQSLSVTVKGLMEHYKYAYEYLLTYISSTHSEFLTKSRNLLQNWKSKEEKLSMDLNKTGHLASASVLVP